MKRGHTINVLDHGYVTLIDSMGSDEDIVEAARMSTGKGFVSWEPYKRCKKCDNISNVVLELVETCRCGSKDWQEFPRGDLGILEFMWKNKHATPFEFGELHVEVQAPIMVFREWHRHRTQAYSEFSARYSQMPDLHYLPTKERIQKQSNTNRQGSGVSFDPDDAVLAINSFDNQQHEIYDHYEALIKVGCAKEIARLNTPVSRYSKMRAKTDLRNWLAFLQLRMKPDAQYEIRQYANAVAEMVKAIWPRTYALFEEHDFHGVRLSRSEAEVLKKLVDVNKIGAVDFETRKSLAAKLGLVVT